MQTITTIGLDIAKSVFRVHDVGTEGNVMLRRGAMRSDQRFSEAVMQSSPLD